jgi:hypothetical protein
MSCSINFELRDGFGDESYPIDESISSDTRDFLEEGLVLLHGFQQKSKTAALEYADDHNDAQIKTFVILQWDCVVSCSL